MILELVEADADCFAALITGAIPAGATSLAETELAPVAVLEMLAALSARIAPVYAPNAWMIIENGCVVGLLTLVTEPAGRAVTIGYGVAESHRGCGVASRAVARVLALMQDDDRIDAVLAETSIDNPASQRVLLANGFAKTGQRCDPEDGELILWRFDVQ